MNSTSHVYPVSTRVVERVAEQKDTSPFSLSPPLTEFVDPDALDALFERADGTVTFDAWGHHITVTGDGSVVVEEISAETVAESTRE